MKKSFLDILNILIRMKNGEDVVENYNSEKTAKSVYHNILDTIDKISWVMDSFSRPGLEKDVYDFNFKNKTGGIEWEELEKPLRELFDSKLLYKRKKGDCLSVKDSAHSDKEPHYGFYFMNKSYEPVSGKYIAYCQNRTNTSKRRTIDEYYDLVKRAIKYYGLYDSMYLPSEFTVYSTQPTEWMFQQKIGAIKELLNSGKDIDKATEKQASWIDRKLNTPNAGWKLNKYQASELLDVLFNGEENKAASNPEEVINHYKNILNIRESKNMKKTIVRLTESDLHNIIEESVKRIIGEIQEGTSAQNDFIKSLCARRGITYDQKYNNLSVGEASGLISILKKLRVKKGEQAPTLDELVNQMKSAKSQAPSNPSFMKYDEVTPDIVNKFWSDSRYVPGLVAINNIRPEFVQGYEKAKKNVAMLAYAMSPSYTVYFDANGNLNIHVNHGASWSSQNHLHHYADKCRDHFKLDSAAWSQIDPERWELLYNGKK